MLTLSLPRVARATVQPWSTAPTTSSSGTKTSLKKTSLNSELPVGMRMGRTSTPGPFMSITMVVMPANRSDTAQNTVHHASAGWWWPMYQYNAERQGS